MSLPYKHPLTLSLKELGQRHADIIKYFYPETDKLFDEDIPQWALDEGLVTVGELCPVYAIQEIDTSRLKEYLRLINYSLLDYCKSFTLFPTLSFYF